MAKILFVDDDEQLIHLIDSAFKTKGHEVVSFKLGKEALEYLQSESNANALSLLILDRMIGDIDGVEILRFFREKYGPQKPILILSSLSAEKDVMHGLEKGAMDYLAKPFSIGVLMQKADKFLSC